jgi:hypothetical protein
MDYMLERDHWQHPDLSKSQTLRLAKFRGSYLAAAVYMAGNYMLAGPPIASFSRSSVTSL